MKVATGLGRDRGSGQGETYTNLNCVYEEEGLTIDCNIGQNMQGYGRLFVVQRGTLVLDISNSHPYNKRGNLPEVTASYVGHKVLTYEPGDWEKRVADLASS